MNYMKKLAGLVGASALLLGLAGAAFACGQFGCGSWYTGGDQAYVYNSSYADANTGGNTQQNIATTKMSWGDVEVEHAYNSIYTGRADADSNAVVIANTHIGCSLCDFGGGSNKAYVWNSSEAYANTGYNSQVNVAESEWSWGDVEVEHVGNGAFTGGAYSDSNAYTVVNTHWTGWGL